MGSTGRTEGERGRGRGRRSVLPARMQLHQQLVAELAEGGAGRETVVQELLQKVRSLIVYFCLGRCKSITVEG